MKPGAPWMWSLTQTALTALKTILVASCALQGLERVCKAVSKHWHLAPMADRARKKAKASTGGTLVWMLHSLDRWQGTRRIGFVLVWQCHQPSCLSVLDRYKTTSAYDGGGLATIYHYSIQQLHRKCCLAFPLLSHWWPSTAQAWCVKVGTF